MHFFGGGYCKNAYLYEMRKMTEKLRLYNRYYSMLRRCYSPKYVDYKNYGAKGITVCDEWRYSYSLFKQWFIENGGQENPSLSIDRINPLGMYSPDNCRLTTLSVQNKNKIGATGSSKYRGVSYFTNNKCYASSIVMEGERFFLGMFDNEENAAKARDLFIINNNISHLYHLNLKDFDYTQYKVVVHKHKQKDKFFACKGIVKNKNSFSATVPNKGKQMRIGKFQTKELAIEARVNWIKKNIKDAEILY